MHSLPLHFLCKSSNVPGPLSPPKGADTGSEVAGDEVEGCSGAGGGGTMSGDGTFTAAAGRGPAANTLPIPDQLIINR